MKEKTNKRKGYTIALVAVLVALMVASLFVSCTPKIVEVIKERVEYRDRFIHDTVSFEIPVEIERIITRDTASHLKNTFAKSDAVVCDGYLFHTLESRPQIIKVPVEIHVTDTIKETAQVQTITEYVEKPLSWWEAFKLKAFWWLVLAVSIQLVWTFRKFIF